MNKTISKILETPHYDAFHTANGFHVVLKYKADVEEIVNYISTKSSRFPLLKTIIIDFSPLNKDDRFEFYDVRTCKQIESLDVVDTSNIILKENKELFLLTSDFNAQQLRLKEIKEMFNDDTVYRFRIFDNRYYFLNMAHLKHILKTKERFYNCYFVGVGMYIGDLLDYAEHYEMLHPIKPIRCFIEMVKTADGLSRNYGLDFRKTMSKLLIMSKVV